MYTRQKRAAIGAARARFEADPEPKREYERRRYAEHKQNYRDRARGSYLRNSDGYKLRAKQRRLRLRGAWTPEGDVYAVFIGNDPCAYCGGPASTTDHIVSLSAGGRHEPDNLANACLSCNASKRDKPLLIYLLTRVAA
jgi:5-methylcytosine-specific restriction endonuclease McrA